MRKSIRPYGNRLTIVTACSGLYGSEQALLDIIEQMPMDQSLKVCLLVPSKGSLADAATRLLPTTRRYRLSQRGLAKMVSRALLILKIIASAPQALYLNEAGLLKTALLAGKLLRVPVTVHVRTVEEASRVYRLLERPKALDIQLIAISQFIANLLKGIGHTVTVLSDGYNDKKGITPSEQQRDKAPFVLSILGRYAASKGQQFVVDALKAPPLALKEVRWQLRLVGVAELDEKVRSIRQELGISELDSRYVVTRFTEHTNEELHEAHVVVVPGTEALGRAYFEAIAAARPVLVASGSGTAELVIRHRLGVIYAKDNHGAFWDQMQHIYDYYQAIHEEVLRRREEVLRQYDMAAYYKKLMAIVLRRS